MGNIMTRAALAKIMADENLTPEQRTESVMSLYGRALDDGYIGKAAAQTAQETAIASAKAEWEKNLAKPDPKNSEEYKALQNEYSAYKTMQEARGSECYKSVKPKFFETVYGMIDKAEGAKPVAEQLNGIKAQYEEYFSAAEETGAKNTPQFSKPAGRDGSNQTSEEDKLYEQLNKNW